MDFETLKKRERFFEIWKNRDNPELLGDTEKWIARAMKELSQYHKLWEAGDVFQTMNMSAQKDPFLHVTIYSMLYRQMEDNNPPEVKKAYDHLIKKKNVNHEKIMDSIGLILADELREMMVNKAVFDTESYAKRVKKFLKM